MVVVHLPPLDKDLYLPSSLLWPRPQDGAGSTHSIVLSDWWTPKPILLGNYFSHVQVPLDEALLSFTYKPPSHPLKHSKEKSPEQEVGFHHQHHQSGWDVRYLPTFAVSTQVRRVPCPAKRWLRFSHLHSSCDTSDVTKSMCLLMWKNWEISNDPLGSQGGSPSLSISFPARQGSNN